MISAVVFDVDGVVVRGGVFGERLRREYGLDRAALNAFWHGPFEQCVLGLADLKREVAPFLRQWGYRGSVEHCVEAWLEADSAVNTAALQEVERLRARGVRCHVASNQERYRAGHLEEDMELGVRFDRLFFSCRMGLKKPERAFFEHIAGALGANPAQLLLIDDQRCNVEAAEDAGWDADQYSFGQDLSALLALHGL